MAVLLAVALPALFAVAATVLVLHVAVLDSGGESSQLFDYVAPLIAAHIAIVTLVVHSALKERRFHRHGVPVEKYDLAGINALVASVQAEVARDGRPALRFHQIDVVHEPSLETFEVEGRRCLRVGWPIVTVLTQKDVKCALGHELMHHSDGAMYFHRALERVLTWAHGLLGLVEPMMARLLADIRDETYRRARLEVRVTHFIVRQAVRASLWPLRLFLPRLVGTIRRTGARRLRQYELYCDHASGDLFGRREMALSILRVLVVKQLWALYVRGAEGVPSVPGFRQFFDKHYTASVESVLADGTLDVSYDTHPSTRERIHALGADLADLELSLRTLPRADLMLPVRLDALNRIAHGRDARLRVQFLERYKGDALRLFDLLCPRTIVTVPALRRFIVHVFTSLLEAAAGGSIDASRLAHRFVGWQEIVLEDREDGRKRAFAKLVETWLSVIIDRARHARAITAIRTSLVEKMGDSTTTYAALVEEVSIRCGRLLGLEALYVDSDFGVTFATWIRLGLRNMERRAHG